MIPRLAGALAIAGGVAWLAKVALIWANGGANTTDGVVGLLFRLGAVALLLAGGLRAWQLARRNRPALRVAALLAVPVVLLAMVDLPILVGWQLFGDSWLAEEVGIVLTAVLSLVVGVRWIAAGFGRASASPARTPQPL